MAEKKTKLINHDKFFDDEYESDHKTSPAQLNLRTF